MKAWKLVLALDALVVAAVAFVFLHPRSQAPRTVRTGVVLVDASLGHATRIEGTGILLTSGGVVVTSNHVINGARSVRVFVPQKHRRYAARILGYDVGRDTAVLQLEDAHGLRTALTAETAPAPGQAVLAVGAASGAVGYTFGRVTGLNKAISASDELGRSRRLKGMIEFDAAIEPGDSGGPLLDRRGRVVGINTAGITRPDFFAIKDVHDSYATPIGTALAVVDDVEHGRMSTRVHVGPTAYLGVAVAGNRITAVVAGSPAARAGLGTRATIAAIDGHALRSADQLTTALLAKRPGDAIAIDWIDAAGRHTTAVVLGRGPAL